jgi:hypothetical protein
VTEANPTATWLACTSEPMKRMGIARTDETAGMRNPEAVLSWTGTPGSRAIHTPAEISSSDGHAIVLKNQPTFAAASPLNSAAMSPVALKEKPNATSAAAVTSATTTPSR